MEQVAQGGEVSTIPPVSDRPLLLIVFVNTALLSMVNPVLPLLLQQMTGETPGTSSYTLGVLLAIFALAMFLCAPVLGALSDRTGRRPIILLALAGAVLDHVLSASAQSVTALAIARILAGACTAFTAAAYAYIVDVTPAENRAQRFGKLGAVSSGGFIVGPGIGGLLAESDPRTPFWVAAILTSLCLAYALAALRESRRGSRESVSSLRIANPFTPLLLLTRAGVLRPLAFVTFMLGLSIAIGNATWVLFVQSRLGWGAREIGLTLTVLGVGATIAQATMPRILATRLTDRQAILTGLSFAIASNLVYTLLQSDWQVLLAVPLTAVAFLAGISIQVLASRQVSGAEQGSLQGAFISLGSISMLLGPLIGASLFGYFNAPDTQHPLPAVGFYGAIACLLAGLLVAALYVPRARTPAQAAAEAET
jgi:MFS transporter, DHA1 family, tetracycline resistance protein